MSNQQNQIINDHNTGGEFSRHWLLVLVCAAGIGVGVSALPFYTQGLFIEAWIADFYLDAGSSVSWHFGVDPGARCSIAIYRLDS